MGQRSLCSHALIGVASALILMVAAREATAQAWVSTSGSLDVGLDYNFSRSADFIVADRTYEGNGTTGHTLLIGAEYVVIENLALNIALPLTSLRFNGPVDPMTMMPERFPHTPHGAYDDGDYHTTLTDLRAGARYQILNEPVALSAHLAGSIPVADYETIGNTVAGRGIKRLHVGASIGYLIGLTGYTNLTYEFTVGTKYKPDAEGMTSTEAVEDHSQLFSDVSFAIGRKLLDYRFDIHAAVDVHRTHGGVDMSDAAIPMLTSDEIEFHDAIMNEDMILVGGGVGYQLSDSLAATLSFRVFVNGVNTMNTHTLALGLAWSPLQPE